MDKVDYDNVANVYEYRYQKSYSPDGIPLNNSIIGQDVFPLAKEYTSQLSLLTDQQYETGIRKIKDCLDSSLSKNITPEFKVDITLTMVTARAM